MEKRSELTIKAELVEIEKAKEFVRAELIQRDCPIEVMDRIELALEEILVNVVSYAYPRKEGKVMLRVLFPESDVVRLEIKDSGIFYDPTAKPDPDITKPLKQRGKGGLGIYMAKTIMDEMIYDHAEGCNHTVMIKKFK